MASIVRLTQNSVCDKKDEHQHSKQTQIGLETGVASGVKDSTTT